MKATLSNLTKQIRKRKMYSNGPLAYKPVSITDGFLRGKETLKKKKKSTGKPASTTE